MQPQRPMLYKDAGVDIDAAGAALEKIKQHARRTFTPNVLTSIGSFGSGFRLGTWENPVLVSSADGVGTKLKVAFLADRHDTIGEDLVNHCTNDILVLGAKPLFFLDYLAMGKMNPAVAEQIVSGIARACENNGCALIGGETAEMPGLYSEGEYDLAGFIVGAVERKRMVTGEAIAAGDVLFGLPSSGLHTNGYSLARKLLFEAAGYGVDSMISELGCTAGEELLKVHRSYFRALSGLLEAQLVKGAAHITGGGITDNLPRVLPEGMGAVVDITSWEPPPIFPLLQKLGNIPDEDYRRTFNLGIGMIVVVEGRLQKAAEVFLRREGEAFHEMGRVIAVEPGQPRIIFE